MGVRSFEQKLRQQFLAYVQESEPDLGSFA
jgi:hypothetical protein